MNRTRKVCDLKSLEIPLWIGGNLVNLQRHVNVMSTSRQRHVNATSTSRYVKNGSQKLPVGGFRRQPSNSSSTIKTDRQIFTRKDSASADKKLHSGLAGISSIFELFVDDRTGSSVYSQENQRVDRLLRLQRHDTSRTRRKTPVGGISLRESRRNLRRGNGSLSGFSSRRRKTLRSG